MHNVRVTLSPPSPASEIRAQMFSLEKELATLAKSPTEAFVGHTISDGLSDYLSQQKTLQEKLKQKMDARVWGEQRARVMLLRV